MNYPKICVPKLLTWDQKDRAFNKALHENPDNRRIGADPKKMAVEVGRKWATGRTLKVRFMNGDQLQRMKAEREARRWETCANIMFAFNDAADAEIRIAFYDGKNWNDESSWSYVGTDALVAPPREQTVNFGWLDKDTSDDEWQRVVVHEFGHVLGCIHEDQQPAETIKWDKAAVYRWFMGPPNNWTKQDVDDNVLDAVGQAGIANTAFDELSIMAYSIPPEFTTDGKGVKGGDTLSELDKKMIGEMYPIGTTVSPSLPNPALVPNGPSLNGTIGVGNPQNLFSLNIKKAGTYRVWTSFTGGLVYIHNEHDAVAHGTQQVTAALQPGNYTVVVGPLAPGNNGNYRIHAAKLS